jgi:hypothetical protein
MINHEGTEDTEKRRPMLVSVLSVSLWFKI